MPVFKSAYSADRWGNGKFTMHYGSAGRTNMVRRRYTAHIKRGSWVSLLVIRQVTYVLASESLASSMRLVPSAGRFPGFKFVADRFVVPCYLLWPHPLGITHAWKLIFAYQRPIIFIHIPPANSQIAIDTMETRKLIPHHWPVVLYPEPNSAGPGPPEY